MSDARPAEGADAVPLRLFGIGHGLGNSPSVRPLGHLDEGGGDGPYVLASVVTDVGEGFVAAALELIAADPRVATVSDADVAIAELAQRRAPVPSSTASRVDGRPSTKVAPRDHTSAGILFGATTALAAQPAGSAVVINARVFDLIGALAANDDLVPAARLRDWSARANHRGLRHVWWQSGESAASRGVAVAPSAVDAADSMDDLSGIAALVDRHLAHSRPIVVAVDASWLQGNETGAQVATVCWIEALADRPDIAEIRLHDLPGGQIPTYAPALATNPKVVVVGIEPVEPADVFWRPYQPDARTLISRDRQRGRRLVTTILDLIDFSNSRYHGDSTAWLTRRRQLRRYTRQVDALTAISRDALGHLAAEVPGLEHDRLYCTPLGVEHLATTRTGGEPESGESPAPRDLVHAWPRAGHRPFVLVLGNDFVHKNRDLAIRAWQEASTSGPVDLVLAGLHVSASSSAEYEDRLVSRPAPGRIIRLEHVSPEAKEWLLSQAIAVLYPTSAEGFGLVPHEAAMLGTPTLFTAFGPLAEFLPAEQGLAGWSVEGYASALADLIADRANRAAAVDAVLAADRDLTWPLAAQTLVEAFRSTLAKPPQPAGLWERTEGLPSGLRVDDLSTPMPPEEAARSLRAAADGRHWRSKDALRRARAAARNARRRLSRTD